jgi:hypothetical protein
MVDWGIPSISLRSAFVSAKCVPAQKSEVAVYKAMIPGLGQLSAQARYEIISAFQASNHESIRDTARIFGVCETTVRSALKQAEQPIPIDQAGRLRVIEQEREDYTERSTNQELRTSRKVLAAEVRGMSISRNRLFGNTERNCPPR